MAVHADSLDRGEPRKRKRHRKSRNGCQNCKLRSIKCDEERPSCQKCIAYRVSCSYDQRVRKELRAPGEGVINLGSTDLPSSPPDLRAMVVRRNPSHQDLVISNTHIERQDLDMLLRFRERTVFTIGNAQSEAIYQQEITRMAHYNPFLMHLVLTLTMMHDRFLVSGLKSRQSTEESFHWYAGTSLFNAALSRQISEADKDALWAAGAVLGAIVFAGLEASTAEEAWPLGPPATANLEWLKLSYGKKAIFRMATSFHPNTTFSRYMHDHRNEGQILQSDKLDVEALPVGFIDLYDLTDPLTKLHSPYFPTLRVLSRLMTIEVNRSTVIKFLSFVSNVDIEFQGLLEQKDPRAMILLVWWYALMCPYKQWWVQKRVVLECQAICIYLARSHPDESLIQEVLRYPRIVCGLERIGKPHSEKSYGVDAGIQRIEDCHELPSWVWECCLRHDV